MTTLAIVAMVRDADEFPDSHEALVEHAEVAEWEGNGWAVAGAEAPKPVTNDGPVEIPAAWQDLHWATRVKLAKALGHDVEKADEANEVIAAEVARRVAAAE